MKTATIYGYAGADSWRYVVEHRGKRRADLNGARGKNTARLSLHAWLIINGFTHYRYGPHGKKQPCDNLK